MRKILTSAIILISLNIYSQKTFEINSNSAWKIDKLVNVISQRGKRSIGDESYKLYIQGDTSIQSQTYFKLYKTGILYLDTPQEYSHVYVGALRQGNSKVFFIESGKNAEETLYDYSLKINDIIQSKIGNGKTVLDTDTLEDGRKRFYISKSMLHARDAYITEGIGSSGGLLFEPSVGHYMYNDHYLICYTENDSIIQNENDPLSCGCLTKPSRFPLNTLGEWNVQYVPTWSDEISAETEDYYHYYISDDTTINNVKYFKLYKSGVAYYDDPFYYNHIYSGAIRDDDNRIFYVKKGTTSEDLILDYNLKIGDKITAQIGKGFAVNKITEQAEGRRIFEVDKGITVGCARVPVLVEGIGHSGGIIETPPCEHPGYMVHYLSCYKVRDSIIYLNLKAKDNACGTNTDIPEKHTPDFEVYPNPFSDQIHIKASQNIDKISILNLDGRLMLSIDNINIANNGVSITTSNLNKGIYIIGIRTMNSGFIYSKIIKK